jgi:hypothetical protein
MELSSQQINNAILILNVADGEDVHEILKQSNWSEQMLKQLIMTENIETVEYWYQQRKAMEEEATEKLNSIQLTEQTEYKTVIFEFSTRENDYTVIYNEDGGDFWKPVWDIRCDGDEVEEDEIREKLISLAKKSINLID